MFDDALMESEKRLTTKAGYYSLFSVAMNSCLLAGLVLWPLLHPRSLPRQTLAMLLTAPAPPPAAPGIKAATPKTVQARVETLADQLRAPSIVRKAIESVTDIGGPAIAVEGSSIASMSGNPSAAISDLFRNTTPPARAVVKAAVSKPVSVSSGVMAGNRIAGVDPMYPAIARAADIHGTVVLEATISRQGTIENLRSVSGPPMLLAAAINAVKTWRYHPYLLNGAPVEVETTINVVFTMGN